MTNISGGKNGFLDAYHRHITSLSAEHACCCGMEAYDLNKLSFFSAITFDVREKKKQQ